MALCKGEMGPHSGLHRGCSAPWPHLRRRPTAIPGLAGSSRGLACFLTVRVPSASPTASSPASPEIPRLRMGPGYFWMCVTWNFSSSYTWAGVFGPGSRRLCRHALPSRPIPFA